MWRDTYHVVDAAVLGAKTGAGEEGDNPFTGKIVSRSVDESIRNLHQRLSAAGLLSDEEFMRALGESFLHVASTPMFGLLTAFDGEGAFEGEMQLKIASLDGQDLEGGLHEVFHDADPRRGAR